MFRKLKIKFNTVKNGVKNLIKWFPVIWEDRDYDYYFLLILMSRKMKNMSELHSKHGMSIDSDKYAEQLKYCSELAEKIAEGNYPVRDLEEERRLAKNDLNKLFTTMEENILNWWD